MYIEKSSTIIIETLFMLKCIILYAVSHVIIFYIYVICSIMYLNILCLAYALAYP